MRVAFVGWEGDHPGFEGVVSEVVGGDVRFLSAAADRRELAAAVPLLGGKPNLRDIRFHVIDGAAAPTVALIGALEKKGAEVERGMEAPEWDEAPDPDDVRLWLNTGRWPRPEPDLGNIADDLFGDLGDADEVADAGEPAPAAPEPEPAASASPLDAFATGGAEETTPASAPSAPEETAGSPATPVPGPADEASPLDAFATGGAPSGSGAPADDGSPEDAPAVPVIDEEVRRRANERYRAAARGPGDVDSPDDGMEATDGGPDGESSDIPVRFVDRDGEISGVPGGPGKAEPPLISGEPGHEAGDDGDDSGDDGAPAGPLIDFDSAGGLGGVLDIGDYADRDSDDEEEPESSGAFDVADIRGDSEEEMELARSARALRDVYGKDDISVDSRELNRTLVNDQVNEGDAVIVEDGGEDSPSQRRRREGRGLPGYIAALPDEAARNRQVSIEDRGALHTGDYTKESRVSPHSLLVVCTGTSGGVGKTLVSYSAASTASRALEYMRQRNMSVDSRPVYLVECDWENPDMEGLLGKYVDRDGNVMNRSVNTMQPLVDLYVQRNMQVSMSDVLSMVDKLVTVDPMTGLKIIPAPYNLESSNDDKVELVKAIRDLVQALLSTPGGAIVFLDCSALKAPNVSPLTNALLSSFDRKVLLVTRANTTTEASRGFSLLNSNPDGSSPSGIRHGRRTIGFGVPADDIKVVLNFVEEDFDGISRGEAMEMFMANTGRPVNAAIPTMSSLSRVGREWVGALGSREKGIPDDVYRREIHDKRVLESRILRVLESVGLTDVGALRKPEDLQRVRNPDGGVKRFFNRLVGRA